MLTATDRLEILEVVTRADNAATRRDADAYVAYFTDDALLDGTKGSYRGTDELRHSVVSIWESEGPASTHSTLNAVIDEVDDDSDRAIVTSQLMILRTGSPPSVVSLSFITQHLRRVDSKWLIERRSVGSNEE
jgi:ketosteroid isomerase-like protein